MWMILYLILLAMVAGSGAISETVANQVYPMQPNLSAVPAAQQIMQETKRMEPWLPSQQHQPELTQMHHYYPQQQQQQPQQYLPPNTPPPLPPLPPTHPPPPPPPQQQSPSYPSDSYPRDNNFYLPPANHHGLPTSTEFRSDHYPYPFEQNYPYPVAQPPLDTSLVPTAKHFVIVSFIGLLLLFAIIQNSIAAAKRKDALVEVLSNRKKRDLLNYPRDSRDFHGVPPELQYALKRDGRISCIQRTLCFENRKLFEDLGLFGKIMAKYLTRSVQNYLKDMSPGWDRLIEDASNTGLRRDNCDVVYRDCNFRKKINNRYTVDEDEEEEEPT